MTSHMLNLKSSTYKEPGPVLGKNKTKEGKKKKKKKASPLRLTMLIETVQ